VQRTIRILRVALPIALVAFIAVIVLNWRASRRVRDRAPATGVTSSMRPFDIPGSEAKSFEDTQTIGGRVVSRIRARRVVAFVKSGWNTLEGVELTIFRPNGLTYELVCPQAQFNSNTKEAEAKGGVKVTSSDGVEITTAELKFDGNHLTNHIKVNFRIDRWTGSGGALDLDVQAEMLHLFDKIDATMQPSEPGELPMNLKADDGVFRRKENNVDFTAHVLFTHGDDRVVCDHMAARLTPDRKTLSALDGNGHVDIVMGASSPLSTAPGRKELFCDRFWSELGSNGQINALNMVGDAAPAHAVIEGPPQRDIVARTFRAAIANRVVTDLKADGAIVMKELGPVPRDVTTEHLVVYFDPGTHKATNAAMEGNCHYTDPKNDARAVRATYDIVNDLVVLTATPGFNPTVVSDGNILKAAQIELSPRAQSARANGDVIAQLVSKSNGPTADATNLFPAGKPVFVNADTLVMRQAQKIAVFNGHVRAWQETNTIFASELQVQGQGDQVTARGGVRTILYNTSSGEARKTPMISHSDTLVAHKNERRVELLGNVKIDDETRHMTGEKATFFFDANKKLEHVESEQKVVLTDTASNRKLTGDKATYYVLRRMVFVDGTPATANAPNGSLTAQHIAYDLARNKVEVVSPTSPTQGTYKPQP